MKATSPQVTEMKEMTDPTPLQKVGRAEVAQCEHRERTPVALTLLQSLSVLGVTQWNTQGNAHFSYPLSYLTNAHGTRAGEQGQRGKFALILLP